MKKPSGRSQRVSRGIKGKHVLQICVLLGVCIWLIYQVKYSHDKKKELYETDGNKKLSDKEDGLVKLGRKDLLPGYHKEDEEESNHGEEEKESKSEVENGTHEEAEEEVAEEDEEDKSKLGEEVVEEDEEENKHEEDEIDEQDQSQTSTGDTDKDDEETNHGDEIDMTVDEAREEHYKADDASSAVSHESSRILNTETLKESSDNSTGGAQENSSNATVSEVEVQKEPVLEKTTTEVKDGDSDSSNTEAKSVVTELRGETVNGNSTEAVLEASGFLQNETRIMQERSQEDGSPPSGSSELQTVVKLEHNITVSANLTNIDTIQDKSRNSSSVIENISGSNTTEVKENTRSEGDDETGEYKESSNVLSTEQTEEADDTTSENTILQEEREALTNPQTLPDIRIEGNEEDEEEAISAE